MRLTQTNSRDSCDNSEIKNNIVRRSNRLSTKFFRRVGRKNVVTESATTTVWYRIQLSPSSTHT